MLVLTINVNESVDVERMLNVVWVHTRRNEMVEKI